MMKKYIIFHFSKLTAKGGLADIRESCNSIERARTIVRKWRKSGAETWSAYIVDRDTWEIIPLD